MVTTKKAAKKPTKKEVQTLVKALDDLLFYSRAHLNNTTREPGTLGSLDVFGKRLYSWGDLNAAIHRAEQMLEGRRGSDARISK